MAITRLTNEHDGWGYFIPASTRFEEFPEEALALLDERDRAIYLDADAHLDSILAGREDNVLTDFLVQLKAGGLLGLEAQFAPDVGPGLKALYFCFGVGDDDDDNVTNVQFTRVPPDPALPSALVSVFGIFDTLDEDFAVARNAIQHPRLAYPFTEIWTEPSEEFDVAEWYVVYTDARGDTIGWHRDGRAALCKDGTVSVIGTISEFLSVYLANLLDADRPCGEADDYVEAMRELRERSDEEED